MEPASDMVQPVSDADDGLPDDLADLLYRRLSLSLLPADDESRLDVVFRGIHESGSGQLFERG